MRTQRWSRRMRLRLRAGGRAVAELRNVVLLALTIILALGAHFYLYTYPSLVDVLIEESEQDAIRAARVLKMVALEDDFAHVRPSKETAIKVEAVRQALGVLKIKTFDAGGQVTYSTDAQELGQVNRAPHFREIVARGHTHKHLVGSEAPSLDGERYDRHLVEVYVPIMGVRGFEGAFEIYYDITDRRADLDLRLRRMNLNLGLMLAVLLAIFAVSVAYSYTSALRRERAHSRRLYQEIEYRLGIEEELRESHGHFRHLAHHDPLTGLPNRTLFFDRFEHALANAARYRTGLALLFIDLDHFKPINDTHGHEAGDRILTTAATILQSITRESDTAARIAGDEFAVLVEHAEESAIAVLANRLAEEFAASRDLGFGEVSISASIGISLYPRDGADMATLMHRADLAMYRAKASRRGSWQYYEDDLAGDAAAG